MSLSLFQESALDASAVQMPVAYPPLSPPDVSNCDGYYANPTPPLLADCREAFKLLPSGTAPTLWYTKPAAGEERNVLPLEVHYGTCQIVFQTSGQSADKVDHYSIVPNDIKAMASWVMAKCCFLRKGGMVTKGLKNTIDASTANPTEHVFPDPPLPPSSSFYSLHIWNFADSVMELDFNSGNSDPEVGYAIYKALISAIRAARQAAPGGPAEVELVRRVEWLWDAVGRMMHWADGHWWDGGTHHDFESSAASRNGSMKNATGGAVNLTHGCSSNDCNGGSTVA